ncbi:MAG: PaaI family thioesterase [Desulfobacterales bacterium]|nr:PaaI family thioesterase [Desulfobacterales bacterium]
MSTYVVHTKTDNMLKDALRHDILERIKKIPIVDFLKLEVIRLSQGFCEVKVPRRLSYDGVFESFHGGLLMTIADSAACFAIFTRSGPYLSLTTTDMNIRFLAPCRSDVTAKARLIKFGKTMCPVAVELFDEDRRMVAVAQVNYMLLNAKGLPDH